MAEDVTAYDSSFFHVSYSGRKVLVLVPHQDDEINVAGNTIQTLLHAGAEVFVTFSTNGDFFYSADTRINEAINSLSVLGVDKSHIFLLGYGDSLNGYPGGHIFNAATKPIASPHFSTQTYGAAGISDFSYYLRKEHSPYTKPSYRRDLKDLILHVRADIILCVDFDFHADHRMLTLNFESVMGEILSRPDNDYKPQVFKRFAYTIAFMAVQDLFADNLLSTIKPSHEKQFDYIIGTSCYSWETRVRMPIPEGCRTTVLAGNTIAEALAKHVSQSAYINAENIINSDEVFFKRRTDSLTYSAKLSATSGNPEYVRDFKMLNVSEIETFTPEWADYLWQPDPEDGGKKLVFTWEAGQTVSRVVLWGNVKGTPIQKVLLKAGGYEAECGPLPEQGLPLVIDIPEQQGLRELSIAILDQGGSDGGLAEVEVFAQKEQEGVIKPFIQVTADDNFVYEYKRKPDEKIIPIGCYCYMTDCPVSYEVKGPAHLEGNNLVFDGEGDVILRAEAGELYCQSVFGTFKAGELEALHSQQSREKEGLLRMGVELQKRNKYEMRKRVFRDMLHYRGIFAAIKYLIGELLGTNKEEPDAALQPPK